MTNLKQHQDRPVSNSDSFFGMALAQAFLGLCYGPVFDQAWDAGEMASAVYEDRNVASTHAANGGKYNLGVKKSLAGDFARSSYPFEAHPPRPFDIAFRPSMSPAFAI